MTAHLMAAVVVFALLPLILFRGPVLRRYLVADALSYAMAFVVWRQLHAFDPYLAGVGLFVIKLAILSAVLGCAKPQFVKWSANRAAIIALLIYALVGPLMLRVPPDGDEPYYLLVTESIVRDGDLDLANQYRELSSSEVRRTDLHPQPGDPVGPNGEQYSRHEPFLSFLLIPGYLLAGLGGAVVTIILFATLLARSTVRLLEDEGIDDATVRLAFPFFAFGPPIVFYAARLWPEVPAAFLFVEGVRAIRQARPRRWIPALFALALLKLRFLLVVLPLVARTIRRGAGDAASRNRAARRLAMGALLLIVPIAIIWLITGNPTSVHSLRAMVPYDAGSFGRGFMGLLIDGAAGLAFQAPFYLLGFFAIARWNEMPGGFRLGVAATAIYILFLIPRAEWHGGWAPPLRYIVFMTPILALGAAAVLQRISRPVLWMIAIWTAGVVAHGLTRPWELFHIANGENLASETLSRMYGSDFSRLFPSLIRPNAAAIIGAILVVALFAAVALWRRPVRVAQPLTIAVASLLLAAAFAVGRQPASVVHFEDAHVTHRGGALFPETYRVARFLYQGGWIAAAGDEMSFLARRGRYQLRYSSASPALITIGGRAFPLEQTGDGYKFAAVDIAQTGRNDLRVLSGVVNLDRLDAAR